MPLVARYIILLFVMILSLRSSVAQVHLKDYDRKRLHAGFYFGANQSKLIFENIEGVTQQDTFVQVLDSKTQLGYHLGGSVNFMVTDMIFLRAMPGFSVADRIIRYNYKIDSLAFQRTRFLKSKFMNFPVHVRFSTPRIGNFRAYLLGGAKISYELTNLANTIENPKILDRFNLDALDKAYDFGLGFDFYLKPFKLSTEARLSRGFSDLIEDEGLARKSLFYMKSHVLYFTVIIH